ncbi:MAG: hypothetical protein RL591_1599 [Planctomycetota bacterium]
MVVGESLCEVKGQRICCAFLSFVRLRFAAIYFLRKIWERKISGNFLPDFRVRANCRGSFLESRW